MPTTTCLYSIVKNTSGVTKKFTFLPPLGRELAPNEEFSIMGSVVEAIRSSKGGNIQTSLEDVKAFERALVRGDLRVLATPQVILRDTAVPANSKMIVLTSGAQVIVDPCWI